MKGNTKSQAEIINEVNRKRVKSYNSNNPIKKIFRSIIRWYRIKTNYMDYTLTRSLRRDNIATINLSKLKSSLIVGKFYKDKLTGRYYKLTSITKSKYIFQFRGSVTSIHNDQIEALDKVCENKWNYIKYKIIGRSFRYPMCFRLYELKHFKRMNILVYYISKMIFI